MCSDPGVERAVCCRAMRTRLWVWSTPPAWSVWPPALQMGLCGSGTPIIPHRVCLFSTRRKVRRRPCAFGLFVFSVCPSHSLPVCLSEHGTPTSVCLCKLWPVPGCCVLDGARHCLWPQPQSKASWSWRTRLRMVSASSYRNKHLQIMLTANNFIYLKLLNKMIKYFISLPFWAKSHVN